MDTNISRAAEIIRTAKNMIALTGAGISTESGIPDFRSADGLWEKYDPAEYATIQAFRSRPERVWEMIFDMADLTMNAKPNPGHEALAELESMSLLKGVITQNIDNLHQVAGSVNVIEYHGNVSRLECLRCGGSYGHGDFDARQMAAKVPPRCRECGDILKPSVIFFGESIPLDAMARSEALAETADVVLVAGTSALVYPAAGIPLIAKQNGAAIIESNIEQTALTRSATDVFILGKCGTTLPELVRRVRSS